MTIQDQVRLIREVIENEFGESLYDESTGEYIVIDWERIESAITEASV